MPLLLLLQVLSFPPVRTRLGFPILIRQLDSHLNLKGNAPIYASTHAGSISGNETLLSTSKKCGPGMEFWELEDHEMAYSWLWASKMWPGNGVLGIRRTRSGLQLAPGIQNVAREWSSGNSKTTKCVTVCLKRAPAAPVRIPPRPPWGVMMLSFETTRNLSAKAVR